MNKTQHLEIRPDTEVDVTAVPAPGGFKYEIELKEEADGGVLESNAKGTEVYRTANQALHEGAAFAEWVAEGSEDEPAPNRAAELLVEVRGDDATDGQVLES